MRGGPTSPRRRATTSRRPALPQRDSIERRVPGASGWARRWARRVGGGPSSPGGFDLSPWGRPYSVRMAHELFIGEVAARSGLSRKALRLYEMRGILPVPHRTPSGYRSYESDVLGLLAFVRRGRRLGLTLAELAHVVALRRAGAAPCTHVR